MGWHSLVSSLVKTGKRVFVPFDSSFVYASWPLHPLSPLRTSTSPLDASSTSRRFLVEGKDRCCVSMRAVVPNDAWVR